MNALYCLPDSNGGNGYAHSGTIPLATVLSGVLLTAETYALPELVDAAYSGNSDDVIQLIASGIDVNSPSLDSSTALHGAVIQNDIALIRYLLAENAKANSINRYSITPPVSCGS